DSVIRGYLYLSGGSTNNHADHRVSGKIPVSANTKYTLSGITQMSVFNFITFWNNTTFLGYTTYTSSPTTFTTPASTNNLQINLSYQGLTPENFTLPTTIQLELDSPATPY